MFRLSFVPAMLFLCSLTAPVVSFAQEAQLRGFIEDDADASPPASVDGLARLDAEFTPLGALGRRQPAPPFAARVAAQTRVVRVRGGADAGIGDIFNGDTSRDQARGITVGAFLLYPEIYIGGGWTDNVASAAGGDSGWLYRVAPSLRGQSDWSRHSLDFNLRGSYIGYPSTSDDNEPFLEANTRLLLDVANETQIELGARYNLSLEDENSVEGAGGDEEVHELGATLGFRRSIGIIGVSAALDVDHEAYSGGSSSSLSAERDNTVLSASLRLDGNTGSLLAPFVEGTILRRAYNQECQDLTQCENRNATGYAFMGGFRVDNGGKLAGELGVGWRTEMLDDSRLEDLSGLTVDGSLIWSPTRLTTLTASATTRFESTTISDASGSVIYSGDIRAAHAFSEALVADAGVGYSLREYDGVDLDERQLRASAGLTWAFSNNVALQTRYTFTDFNSTAAGRDYQSNMIEAGLRFRH